MEDQATVEEAKLEYEKRVKEAEQRLEQLRLEKERQ